MWFTVKISTRVPRQISHSARRTGQDQMLINKSLHLSLFFPVIRWERESRDVSLDKITITTICLQKRDLEQRESPGPMIPLLMTRWFLFSFFLRSRWNAAQGHSVDLIKETRALGTQSLLLQQSIPEVRYHRVGTVMWKFAAFNEELWLSCHFPNITPR